MDRLVGKGFSFRIIRRIPLVILINPFGFMLSLLIFLSGIPLVLGNYAPQSIQATLPDALSRGWGVVLTLGAALHLGGSFIAHRRAVSMSSKSYATGQEMERIGLLLLGYTSAIYASCVVGYVGWKGVYPFAVVLAFGAVCWIQAFLIRVKFTFAYQVALEYGDDPQSTG